MKSSIALPLVAASTFALCAGAHAADYFSKQTTAPVELSVGSGIPVTVLSVEVPAGIWVVVAKASLVNKGLMDWGRCSLVANRKTYNDASAMVGLESALPAVSTVTVLAVIPALAESSSRKIQLQCSHDDPNTPQYVDSGASIVITRAPGTD